MNFDIKQELKWCDNCKRKVETCIDISPSKFGKLLYEVCKSCGYIFNVKTKGIGGED